MKESENAHLDKIITQTGSFPVFFSRNRSLSKQMAYHWELTAYVTDDSRAANMRAHLTEAEKALERQETDSARDLFNQARREYILARQEKAIFYWRSWVGIVIALILLFIFSIFATAGLVYKADFESEKFIILFAALGGGIGGSAAVLLQVIDVDPHSEVVSKPPWYIIKPCLGAVLGMITYLAVWLSIDLVSTQGGVDRIEGAIIIGFLAGFFESFSKGILARTAGQYANIDNGATPVDSKNPQQPRN